MARTHVCPGGCGRTNIPQHLLACRGCWYRLPQDLRRRITYAWQTRGRDRGQAHMTALAEATAFYAAE